MAEQTIQDRYFAFTEWVGHNHVRLHEVWVHRYLPQKEENYRTTKNLWVYWINFVEGQR